MALYLTGESPEGGQDSDKPIAKTKGILREGESESRRRQTSGPTNRNFMITLHKRADEIGVEVINDIFEKLFNRKTSMTDEDIQRALDPVLNTQSKTVIGGTAPEEVARQLAARQAKLDTENELLSDRMKTVCAAKERLERLVQEFIA